VNKTLNNDVICTCGSYILKSYGGGKSKLRSMVVVIENDLAKAVCRGCKKEHILPVTISFNQGQSPNLHFVFSD